MKRKRNDWSAHEISMEAAMDDRQSNIHISSLAVYFFSFLPMTGLVRAANTGHICTNRKSIRACSNKFSMGSFSDGCAARLKSVTAGK